jgi:hypothetical protein
MQTLDFITFTLRSLSQKARLVWGARTLKSFILRKKNRYAWYKLHFQFPKYMVWNDLSRQWIMNWKESGPIFLGGLRKTAKNPSFRTSTGSRCKPKTYRIRSSSSVPVAWRATWPHIITLEDTWIMRFESFVAIINWFESPLNPYECTLY